MFVLRRENEDVVLADTSVSGFHAVLFCEDGRYTIADLGSANGSFLNKQRVSGRTEFSEGDKLSFGSARCEVGDNDPRRRATVVMPAMQPESSTQETQHPTPILESPPPPVPQQAKVAPPPNEPATETAVKPVTASVMTEPNESVPDFLKDDAPESQIRSARTRSLPHDGWRPFPHPNSEDSIAALARLTTSRYREWAPAALLVAGGTILYVLATLLITGALPTQYATKASGAKMDQMNFLLMFLSVVLIVPGYSVALATAARVLGYGIESPFTYGLLRAFPLIGALMVFYLAVFAPALIVGVIGGITQSVPLMIIALLFALFSIYLGGRLWPMIIMAVSERDALAVRAAWQLTRQRGAWTRATLPLLGWMILVMLMMSPLIALGNAGGILGFVISSIIGIFLLMPVFSLLIVSRYMRLHTLQAS